MKTQSFVIILFSVLMSMIGTNVFAHDIEVKNADGVTIYYIWTNNKTELSVCYRGDDSNSYDSEYLGSVAIPESVVYEGRSFKVTSIFYNAFRGCTGLSSVVIPSSVTSILDFAFLGCTNLTSVTIPNSISSIGYDVFYGTEWYDSQPDGLLYVGKCAYKYKGDMPATTNVTIKDGTLEIAGGAFEFCNGLTSVTIPNSVTSIGNYAFSGCSGLTSVTIPNNVTAIGYLAFNDCSSLASITITDSNKLSSIGYNAFRGTTWLDNQPDGLVYVGNCAYRYKGTMPGKTEITIKDGTLGIAGQAFSGCSGLTSVTIPNSVIFIGMNAFNDCSTLSTINVDSGNQYYDSRNNCNAIIETSSNTLLFGCKNTVIPNSVTSIGSNSFEGCTGLTSITIPNNVSFIGDDAFHDCTSLTSLKIGNGVISIGKAAFSYCTSLTSVILPNSVASISEYAFLRCTDLTSVIIPSSVSSIDGRGLFDGCCNLAIIKVENNNPYFDSRDNCNAIIETSSNTLIAGCNNSIIPSSVTSIGSFAFEGCHGLTSVTIPSSVTSISSYAFNCCFDLAYVTIPNSVTSIGVAAFQWCGLKTVVSKIEKPFELKDGIFQQIPSDAELIVPKGTKALYEAIEGWNKFAKITESTSSEEETNSNTPIDYSKQPFTIVAIDVGTIQFSGTSSSTIDNASIEYSTDNGNTWGTLYRNNTLSVSSGQKVNFRSSTLSPIGYVEGVGNYLGIGNFSSTGRFNVEGNIMSLYFGDNFSNQTSLSGKQYAFVSLFSGSTNLISAENLVLPATDLSGAHWCYSEMFYGCTSLTSAPVLPATTLAPYCYVGMFQGCTSLTTASALTATTLTSYCYARMFNGCTSLTMPPALPATTLTAGCYAEMFNDCKSLTAAPELPATTLESECYNQMFSNCTSLVTAPALPATTLAPSCYGGMFYGCNSLTTSPALPATTLVQSCYHSMFDGCTSLTTAPELPATTLADWCYVRMFENCTSLTAAPSLPAIALTQSCYSQMFSNCTSLATAPALPATTLAPYCYYQMFVECTSLTTAPVLPAKTLVEGCYLNMFSVCTSLNFVKCLATDVSANDCTAYWLSFVPSTGTFVKTSSMNNWSRDESGIPSGWTIQNYDESSTETDQVFSVDGIYYKVGDNNTVSVTSGDVKYSGDVVIPEQVTYNGKTYSVTSIGGKAFFGCTGLTNVAIPNSVTKINYSAFEGCSGLTSITIPNSIKEIWDNAFEGCVNLTAVYISDLKAWLSIWYEESSPVPFYSSPLYYAGHLFLNGSEIKDLVIPNNITSIGHFGFLGCIGLTSVTIPNSVTSIGYYAFSYCNSLTTIVSEIENPFKIYNGNFSDDTYKNAELIVPKGTKALYQATEGWNKFTKITEAEGEVEVSKFSVNSIYYKVGENNTVSVTSGELKYSGDVLIPEQVTYNGKTYSVISIEKYAFQGCSGLTSVTIGNNVTSIGSLAFDCCSGLTSIIIPNSVNSIGSEAFWDCTSLTTINIPNSVTRIGEEAFRGCNNLSSVHITDIAAWCNIYFDYAGFNQHANPLTIAPHLYLNGIEIKDMIIPKSVISISDFSFYGWSGLTSVTITNNVTTIGRMAFNGCNGLATIVLEKEEPFVINSDIFSDDTYTNAELIVPKGTKALYQATEGWNKFARITEAADKDESLFTIDGITYQGSKSEKNVVVKAVDTSKTWMEIPASVSYDGITYQVAGIDNDVFKGSSMAALIWDVEAVLPNNAFSNASIGSNFLLYVKSSSYAPSSVKNVVVNGTAQTIVLSDDGGQFYCPQVFTARSISYTHNYSMETDIGKAKGWETLVLPFDVQKITHNTRGEIVPFPSYNSSSTQKPFWLANFSGNGFRRTAAVLANEPYIIAMPNSSSYRNEYNLAGDVTFSADNVQVPKTPSFSGTFVPAFATVAKSSSVYALNVNNRHVKYSGNYDAGSRFIANLRDVRPFEAYMTGSSSTRGIIEINFNDGTTDMLDILLPTDESQKVSIHTLSGQQIIRTTQRDFNAVWQQLPKGVYIINGKKRIK